MTEQTGTQETTFQAETPGPYHGIGHYSPETFTVVADAFYRALAEPFHPSEIQWRPIAFPKNRRDRALVVPYYDVRLVYDRLDAIVGPANWQIRHEVLSQGVYTEIGLYLAREWIWKGDIGMVGRDDETESATKAKGDATDGAKRAGALWGIGRVYWMIPKSDDYWVDYDDQKKRIVHTPALPIVALPYEMQEERRAASTKRPKPKPEKQTEPSAPPPADEPPEGRPLPADVVRQRIDDLYRRIKENRKVKVPTRNQRSQLNALIETAFSAEVKRAGREAVLRYIFAETTAVDLNEFHIAALTKYLEPITDPDGAFRLPAYVRDELLGMYEEHGQGPV